jgi:Ser/Thr protein kinase RdoA (MazF antagonist)
VEQIRERLKRVEDSGRPGLQEPVLRLRRDCARLEGERHQNLPMGLIHGDLFRDNVLLEGNEVCALLDFESASYGCFAYDLMVTVLAWCFGDALAEGLVAELLRGYLSVRSLSEAERGALVTEGAFACVRFATTRLTDFSLRVAEGETPGRDFRRFFLRQDALETGVLTRILDQLSQG